MTQVRNSKDSLLPIVDASRGLVCHLFLFLMSC